MDIISLPIEYDHSKIDSRFRLIAIASQRAKELALGANPRVKSKSRKVTTLSIEEAIDNTVEFLVGEEAVKAREEASKFDYRKLLEEKKREVTSEDLSEFEKDLKVYLNERDALEKDKKALEGLFGEKQEEGAEE